MLTPSMGTEDIPMSFTRKMKNLFNLTLFTCFMLIFSIQTDKNSFHGCPSRLGHHQRLRDQHPDDVQQDSTFSSTLTYYICFMPSFSIKTDINKFHVCRSQLGHPHELREQHTDGLTVVFYIIMNPYILYMFYA